MESKSMAIQFKFFEWFFSKVLIIQMLYTTLLSVTIQRKASE